MNAYEAAKANVARAEKMAQAKVEGKTVEYRGPFDKRWSRASNSAVEDFFDDLRDGFQFRIAKAPKG